jgi:hypothetical protein
MATNQARTGRTVRSRCSSDAARHDDTVAPLDLDDQDYPTGCECEQDWSCPLHAGQATWIERRYQGLDALEAGR